MEINPKLSFTLLEDSIHCYQNRAKPSYKDLYIINYYLAYILSNDYI